MSLNRKDYEGVDEKNDHSSALIISQGSSIVGTNALPLKVVIA